MINWKTAEIKALLAPLCTTIKESEWPGGDYDTISLMLQMKPKGETLYICGFNPEETMADPNDAMIEMVEASDGRDSRGGLQSSNAEFCAMYGRVVSALRQKGFVVVPKMDEYF